jgi:5-methylcytosine-specific restriction protein A
MPNAPLTFCRHSGCRTLVASGYCREHKGMYRRESAAARGYGHWWRNAKGTGMADRYLAQNPLCGECKKEGRVTLATCVDHVVPHRGDKSLLRDWNNLQSLCGPHHNKKTARGE